MPALMTVGALIANPGATFTAAAASTGDSLQVPSFNVGTRAFLTSIIRSGATAGAVRVRSARLHDNTQGIRFDTDKARTVFQMPQQIGQPIYPGDVLTTELTGGTAETDAAALTMYIDNLPGVNSRLARLGDIVGRVNHIKPVRVALSGQTAGQWKTAALNATEDLLEAGYDYAVLGFQVDAAVGVVAIQGPDTGNYRVGCPGDDSTLRIDNYFISESDAHQLPMIPVINANNKAATNVMILDHTTSQAPNVEVILAQLATPFTGSGS